MRVCETYKKVIMELKYSDYAFKITFDIYIWYVIKRLEHWFMLTSGVIVVRIVYGMFLVFLHNESQSLFIKYSLRY